MMIILLFSPFLMTQAPYISNASSLGRLLLQLDDDSESLGARKGAFCDDSDDLTEQDAMLPIRPLSMDELEPDDIAWAAFSKSLKKVKPSRRTARNESHNLCPLFFRQPARGVNQ